MRQALETRWYLTPSATPKAAREVRARERALLVLRPGAMVPTVASAANTNMKRG